MSDKTDKSLIRCVVAGATGVMGRNLVQAILQHPRCVLTAALVRSSSPYIGTDIGHIMNGQDVGILCSDDIIEACLHTDAIIDFTHADYSVSLAEMAAQARLVHIIGTTGFSPSQHNFLTTASRHARIVQSANMSLGINLLQYLAEIVTDTLDDTFDIEIIEAHHNQKKDSPSGTALMLGQAIAKTRNIDLNTHAEFTRCGTQTQRQKGYIGFSAIRGGNIVGEHEVCFLGPKEHIKISHHAQDRTLFTDGAIHALLWALSQDPGLYSMQDVLKKSSHNTC